MDLPSAVTADFRVPCVLRGALCPAGALCPLLSGHVTGMDHELSQCPRRYEVVICQFRARPGT